MTEYEKNLDGLKRMRIALATVSVDGKRVEPYLTAAIEACGYAQRRIGMNLIGETN